MISLDDTVKSLDAAVNNKDVEAVMDYYEQGAVLVMEPGRVATGTDEIRRFFSFVFDMNIQAHQETTYVLQAQDIALFTSRWIASGVDQNGEKFSNVNIATSVFRKGRDGKWRMIIDNSFGPAVLDVTSNN